MHPPSEILEFRDATIADLETIVAIYNSTIAGGMVTADTMPVTVDSRQEWFRQHETPHRPLWIVLSGDKTIGWVSFQSFYGRPAYRFTAEISIYLHESQRGKGFGKNILRHAMDSCSRLEIKTLLGFIFAHNFPSIRLFTASGFETWGSLAGVATLGGIERDLVILGKRINP